MNMIRFISALLCCLPLLLQAQGYTVIEGKIDVPAGTEASVTAMTDLLRGEKTMFSTPVGYDGVFKLAFKPDRPMLVRFEHAFENMLIYVSPGDRLKVSFEAEKMWETIKFEGDGANNNNYMVAYYNKFGKEVDQTYINLETDGMSSNDFAKYADSIKTSKLKFYEDYKRKIPFTGNFDEYAKGDIVYNWAYDKLRFAASKAWETGNSYYSFMSQVTPQNDKLMASGTYTAFLQTYFDYLYHSKRLSPNTDKLGTIVAEKYNFIKNKLSGDLLYYTTARMLINACNTEEISDIEPVYNQFQLVNPYPHYDQVVGERFKIAKKFAPGSPAPEFMLYDPDGNAVFLSDFRGKVVYMDFWASWCNPCLQQMKYTKVLEETLKNEDIVFLYVSLDTDEKAWKDMIKKRNITGVQVRTAGADSEMAQDYNVSGVPVYFFIDKNGNFAGKPPLPSAKDAFLKKVEVLVSKEYKE
jgi:thiol-disulfide isomerase/thioredoxin